MPQWRLDGSPKRKKYWTLCSTVWPLYGDGKYSSLPLVPSCVRSLWRCMWQLQMARPWLTLLLTWWSRQCGRLWNLFKFGIVGIPGGGTGLEISNVPTIVHWMGGYSTQRAGMYPSGSLKGRARHRSSLGISRNGKCSPMRETNYITGPCTAVPMG